MAGRPARLVLALAVAAGCMAEVSESRADEPLPPTPDTNPEVFPQAPAQPNLLLIGAALTAGWYGGAVGVSYLWQENPGASDLRIPIAGPYMALAKTGCGDGEPTCGTFLVVFRTILTGLTAVGQTGGVLAMLEGAFLPTSASPELAPERRARKASVDGDRPTVAIVPVAGGAGLLGLGVSGNF